MDETVQMFVEEAKEHLEDIESDLLQIEEQGRDVDPDLVNKVFRAAHSMKGGAGFLGFDNIKELAHKTENILDLIRNGEILPSSEVVNTVLSAFDRLNELADHIEESNELDISEHLVALQGLAYAHLEEEQKESLEDTVSISHPDGRVLFTPTSLEIEQSLKGGALLYLIEYDLIHDVQRRNKTPMQVLKELGESGAILDLAVDLPSVGTLEDEDFASSLPMHVLFSSVVEPDLVGRLLELPSERISTVARESAELLGAEVQQQEPSTRAGQEESAQSEEPVQAEEPVREAPAQQEQSPSGQETPQQEEASAGAGGKSRDDSGDKGRQQPKSSQSQSETLRVNVGVLDQLMNLAGELVLSRNQLLQAVSSQDLKTIQAAGQRIDLVTSELQEAIMLTRMQPVGSIFNKFPRVVRDISQELGKEIELEMDGKEVELDKAIIEGLGDPLTHLVRNSADHGLEYPQEREAKGKPRTGTIHLRASHQSGQVNIEIEDDGKGMDPEKIAEKAVNKGLVDQERVRSMSDKEKINLIMLPGLSTADQVSDLSGRGVGMDVVKANLDKLGGQAEIDSQPDKGTTVRIKLPLTLAIIPSLLVTCAGESFAIAQVNVSELLRLGRSEVAQRMEKVGDAEVLILRGELLPLVHLDQVLGLRQTYLDPHTGTYKPDRRSGLADDRKDQKAETEVEAPQERRGIHSESVSIVVVQAGAYKYGMVVDHLHDSVEIVVKPLGRHLKSCEAYAGATIMGDGHVALILDVPGVARKAELGSLVGTEKAAEQELRKAEEGEKAEGLRHSLLTFENAPGEPCAVPLEMVFRVEQIRASDIEIVGGKKILQYRGGSLAVYALEELTSVGVMEDREDLVCIVCEIFGHKVGFLACPPVDVIDTEVALDEQTLRHRGIKGSGIINGRTTLFLDVFELFEGLHPQWSAEGGAGTSGERKEREPGPASGRGATVLLVEDSDFFRSQVRQLLTENGYSVVEAENGKVAWDYLREHPEEVRVVVADLEMPVMDGFEMTEKIKGDQRLSRIPVIALTSLASEEDQAKGSQVGIDEYQIKLDRNKLLQSLAGYTGAYA